MMMQHHPDRGLRCGLPGNKFATRINLGDERNVWQQKIEGTNYHTQIEKNANN
jgi:hypothetical protein